MGILATIVTDVWRDASQNHDAPFSTTHTQCVKHAECWTTIATADWEIRAASWQWAGTLEASSSKRAYEENGRKVYFIFSI